MTEKRTGARVARQRPHGEGKHAVLGKLDFHLRAVGAVEGLELGEPRSHLCLRKTILPAGSEVLRGDKAGGSEAVSNIFAIPQGKGVGWSRPLLPYIFVTE